MQNLTVEFPAAPGGVGLYQSTVNNWPEDLLYDPIFNYNLTGTSSASIPWLGTSYTENSNAQLWTFTLRQGVKFSDGTAFNATSLKQDIDLFIISNTANVGSYAAFIRGSTAYIASNHNAANQTLFENNDGLTVTSPYTLQLNLSKPESDLLSYFTGPFAYPNFAVSPTALAANGGITVGVGSTWLISHSAGEGPYILQSYNSATGSLVFTANPNWWAISALGVKQPFYQITCNVVTNLATEELDVRTGTASIISLPVSNVFDFANRTTYQASGQMVSTVKGVSLWGPYSSTQFDVYAFNQRIKTSSGAVASVQPLTNAHIVAGINEAWNASAFIQQDLNGLAVASTGLMLQGQIGYQKYAPYFKYNLTQAKLDLQAGCQALGCSASNPLSITLIATNDQIAELAGSLLVSNVNSMNAGITINLQPLATSAKISATIAGTFGITLFEMPNLAPDPLSSFVQFATPSGHTGAQLSYNNSAITSMITQAAATSNLTQRQALYLQIDQAIAQTGAFPAVAQFDVVFATASNVKISPYNALLINTLPPILAFSTS